MLRIQVENQCGSSKHAVALVTAIVCCVVLNLAAQSTNCVTPDSGLISWWPGDGNATDFVGGADGAFGGGYTNGVVGQGFSLGSAISLLISNRPSLNPTNGLTIEAWVRARGGGGGNSFYIVSKDGQTTDRQYILSIGPAGKFRAHIAVPSLIFFDGATTVTADTWYYVAMTYDRTSLNLYVNGNLDGSAAATGPIIVTPQPLRLGGGSGSVNFVGVLDEVSLYDRALSASEIQAIYQANTAGKCKTPFPPSIVSEPASEVQPAGATVLFSVSAIGTPPLVYQWFVNGSDIPGATSSDLQLTNVQIRNTGMYSVLVSNIAGAVTSAPATLTVTDTAPIILTGPSNRNAIGGSALSLSVSVHGTEFLSYQWRINGTNFAGATDSTLAFGSVQSSNSGKYDVVITNPIGAATSRVATLTVKDYGEPATIVAWGDNRYGQTNTPIQESNIVALAAGQLQTVFLRRDGTLGDFGDAIASPATYALLPPAAAVLTVGFYGLELGFDGHPTAYGVTYLTGASDVPLSVTNAVAIAIGTPRLALLDNGTVTGWLPGLYSGPPDPSGIFAALSNLTSVADIAMRNSHCLALLSNRTVVAFGSNGSGETNVPPGLTNVIAIAAGPAHCLALNADGTVVAWGNNSSGQIDVPTGLSNVIAISAGDLHNLALKSDGKVVAWGDNTYGQCNVPSGLSNVVFISAGNMHSAALTKSPAVEAVPLATNIFAGGTATFTAFATGYAPLTYQWTHAGTNIVGATESMLVLTNVPLVSAGSYVCVVSNAFGLASSSSCILTVIRQPLIFSASWPGALSSNGSFGLLLNHLSGHGNVIIQASTNLQDWQAIYTNPPFLGSLQFYDQTFGSVPQRFYRAIEQ